MKLPRESAVVAATWENRAENGKPWRSSAIGVRPAPRTVPRIVSPVPHTGRVVDGVGVIAVATRGVVNARSGCA